MSTKIEKILENNGFSEKESIIYITLLKLGRASAYKVAVLSKIKKPTAYVILNELVKKGLVLKIPDPKKNIFIAKDPKDILESRREMFNELRSITPLLSSFFREPSDNVQIYTYDGIPGVGIAMLFGLEKYKNKTYRAFYGNPKSANSDLKNVTEKSQNFIKKNNIFCKVLSVQNKSLAYLLNDSHKEIKIIPNELFESNCGITIFDDMIKIFFFEQDKAIVIVSTELAKTLQNIFDLIYNSR